MRPLGTSRLLARDHAIFLRKIAGELILIAHFTYLILGTIQSRARYTRCACRMLFFNIYYESFVSDDYSSNLSELFFQSFFDYSEYGLRVAVL